MSRSEECLNGARARFHTWALIEAAEEAINPRRGSWKPDAEQAFRFLSKVDMILGLSNRLDLNDPIIAEDFGGDDELWKIRRKIRDAVALIAVGKGHESIPVIVDVNRLLFNHALIKTVECMEGKIGPMDGVSI